MTTYPDINPDIVDEPIAPEAMQRILAQTGRFPKTETKIEAQTTDTSSMPALPAAHLHFPSELSAQACSWLDQAWIPWSRTWSPNSYDYYHEMNGIALLSAIALRRVMMNEGGIRYTNLYCLLAGKSGWYAKSTSADLIKFALRAMQLEWILADDDATPQKFISDLTEKVDERYQEMDALEKYEEERRLAFAGQKFWLYDEFGSKISAIAREGGFMTEYRKIFRSFDGCPPTYSNSTMGRGRETINRPYLSLLGSLTPKDARIHAGVDATMWGDGFLGRFLFACPPAGLPPRDEERPLVEMTISNEITSTLLRWHDQLGVQRATITNEGTDTKPRYSVTTPAPEPMMCHWTPAAHAAYRAYRTAIMTLQGEVCHDDLDSNYIRLPEYAIRVAMLFASLDNNGVIELRHWARAQTFIEHCREGLHHFYSQVNTTPDSQDKRVEDKIFQIIQQNSRLTRRDICRLSHESAAKVRSHLQELERDNMIQSEKIMAKNGKTVIYYWVAGE